MLDVRQDDAIKQNEWRVVSVVLYDEQAEELLRTELMNLQVQISTELISNFIQTLNNFTRNQFDQQVNEIHLGQYRLLFRQISDFILMSVVELGDHVNTGKNSTMSRAVHILMEQIISKLGIPNSTRLTIMNSNLGFVELMMNVLNEYVKTKLSQNYIANPTKTYYVTSVIITDVNGRAFVSRSYENGVYAEDPLLISSLLSAITSFAAQITNLPFNEIVLDNYRIYMEVKDQIIYAITIELEDNKVVLNHNSEVSKKIQLMHENIIHSTKFLSDETINSTININYHTTTAIIDAIVIKSLQNTLGKKNIDRENLKDIDVFNQKSQISDNSKMEYIEDSIMNKIKNLLK